MKNHKYLPVITGIFTACLLISNTLDTKLFVVGSLTLTGGLLLFPILYVFGDILTEVYGYSASRKVIWTGGFSLILMMGFYEIVRHIPPAPFWEHQKDYENILGKVPRIGLASIIAYLAGEFANSYTLAKMKIRAQGAKMGMRFILSTLIGEAIDTVVFVVIAFAGVFETNNLIQIIFSGWLVKVGWEIIALPLTITIVKWLKKAEGEDHYDVNTEFNPFKIGDNAEK